MEHYTVLILIMISFGILGGIVNYFFDETENKKKVFKFVDYKLLKSIFTGIVASLLVPLFLNMISSNIIEESKVDMLKLLIFCGFCLVASISSKAFIQSISAKVLEKVDEVKEDVKKVKEDVSPLIHKESESEDQASVDESEIPTKIMSELSNTRMSELFKDTDNNKVKVLKALVFSNFTYRSKSGICKDTGLSSELVSDIINEFIIKEIVGQIKTEKGLKFYITEKGRDVLH